VGALAGPLGPRPTVPARRGGATVRPVTSAARGVARPDDQRDGVAWLENRMPAVNDAGESCAGRPHARFDGGSWKRSVLAMVTTVGQPEGN
jgi:hypothetical protein